MTREQKVALWDAINRYVRACGGSTFTKVYGNTSRQGAVAEIERLVAEQEAAPHAPITTTTSADVPRCAGCGDCPECRAREEVASTPGASGELKPCPFCGSAAEFGSIDEDVPADHATSIHCGAPLMGRRWGCVTVWGETRRHAIQKWNRRVDATGDEEPSEGEIEKAWQLAGLRDDEPEDGMFSRREVFACGFRAGRRSR